MGGGVAFFERWSTLAVSDRWQPQLPLLERSMTKKAFFLPSAAMATRKAVSRPSPSETRISLVAALASQAFSASQRLPDLETVRFKTLRRTERYEIREVEPYFVAETSFRGNRGFDFSASSQGFNALASYLFGQNTVSERMEMTMPVDVEKSAQSAGEKMEMTTPVITKQSSNQGRWQMSFVLPSKYNDRLPIPKDSSVRIKAVPSKTIAVSAFSGFVTDEEVQRRESELRDAVKNDAEFQIKANSLVEVAQFNPPFTLPFMRRNEIALEVERKNVSASKFSPDISGNLSYDDTPGLP